jgi:hypothetical protein
LRAPIRSGRFGRVAQIHRITRALLAVVMLLMAGTLLSMAQRRFGPSGAERDSNRVQQWLVPSPDTDTAAHALYRHADRVRQNATGWRKRIALRRSPGRNWIAR